jgi:hypothetical protein
MFKTTFPVSEEREGRKAPKLKSPNGRPYCARFFLTALVVVAMISLLFVSLGNAQTTPTMGTDKQDYSPEETVTIYGAGFSSTAQVTITVTGPAGAVTVWQVTTDQTGSFTTTYQLNGVEGTYTVTATCGTQTATTTFTDKVPKTVAVTTMAGGSVTCQYPGGPVTVVSPGSTKVFTVPSGSHITFTAIAVTGYVLTGWSGDLSGTTSPQTIEVDSGRTVTASFGPVFVVPEYLYGAIGSLIASFAAFIIFKKHQSLHR